MSLTLKFHNVFRNCQSLHVRPNFFGGEREREKDCYNFSSQRAIPLKLYDCDSLFFFLQLLVMSPVKAQESMQTREGITKVGTRKRLETLMKGGKREQGRQVKIFFSTECGKREWLHDSLGTTRPLCGRMHTGRDISISCQHCFRKRIGGK